MVTSSNFYLLYRLNNRLILLFHPIADQINVSSASFNDYLISFFHPFLDRIFIFCIVSTITWLYYFTCSKIKCLPSTSFISSVDFVFFFVSRSNVHLLNRFSDHLITFFHLFIWLNSYTLLYIVFLIFCIVSTII